MVVSVISPVGSSLAHADAVRTGALIPLVLFIGAGCAEAATELCPPKFSSCSLELEDATKLTIFLFTPGNSLGSHRMARYLGAGNMLYNTGTPPPFST